jgi:hypothetical protein
LSELLKIAKDAQKNYRWTKKLVTTAYDIPIDEKKKGKRRRIMSNLFVGDWTRLIEPLGQESKIRFRGGEGEYNG